MKKLLLVLLPLGFYSCSSDAEPITQEDPCNKSLIYNTYVINEANYHLYSIGDIICEDDFPNETIGNPPPSI